ncbi:hypothetical protein PHAMO_20092 [Magnetospirillum molischianum DSM 120]|uniref:Uncharacterized protein n=1 Tax=Magnetospirillum molischianum DSM 120 TaxID=1150626 RepID=H8FPW8_MAGML|nr:hypothetical protein PHAMO_20092 [Magnetospirillum molischianum DSM 120]
MPTRVVLGMENLPKDVNLQM